MDIHILDKKIDEKDLKHLVDRYFKDMVKFVVDIEKEIAFRLIWKGNKI